MNATFSIFPSGRAGVALLLLRMSVGAALVVCAIGFSALSFWFKCGLLLVALLLAIGLVTPIAALISAIVMGISFLEGSGGSRHLLLLHALSAVALALLGAGAYSLDAWMFGRRIIELGE